MNAQELRIGNYVYDTEGKVNIVCVQTFVKFNYQIKPIPLTEEWLIKLGFGWDIYYQGYTDGNWVVTMNNEGSYRIAYGKRRHDIIVWKIEFVHRFQNLYFSLTGQELTIKP